jgi:type I restriction enzyme M protein
LLVQAALDAKTLAHYSKLTVADIKTLVVDDKWIGSLRVTIDGEVQRVTQKVAERLKELDERYAQPLPALRREIESLGAQVEKHLKKMGLAWA